MTIDIEAFASIVDDAALNAQPISQFEQAAFDLDQAYQIQASSIQRRVDRGATRTGIKLGFTSKAKMQQMGVHDLIWGRLTSGMAIEAGGTTPWSEFIHPRVEPEVAFLLDKELSGSVTVEQAMSAVSGVAPALEIIDSRYKDFKFSLNDVVADNASASGYVVGEWLPASTDLDNLGIIMNINGEMRQTGSTAAILGSPYQALVEAARLAESAGEPLQPGWIVLAGAATAAEFMKPGSHIVAEFQNLGSLEFSME